MNPRRRRALAQGAALGTAAMTPLRLPASTELMRQELRTSDNVRLSLLASSAAAADRTTLVFVPGWGMPASIWAETLRYFGPRYRCVALDPRGQGESEIPAQGYSVDRRAADIAELLSRFDRAVLVGWSLGVLESLHCMRAGEPDNLAAMVLVDNSVGEPPAPKATDFLNRLRADREATVDRFVRGMFATPPTEARIEEIKRSVLRTSLEQSIALLSYPLPREHWRNIARGLRKPLAYFVTPRFAEQARNLKTARPATTVEVFDGAGHALFVDQAARFNASLDALLSKLA